MVGSLINKRELCVETFEYTFELSEPILFQAGQYVFLTFKNPKFPDYQGSRRYFTIASSPAEKNKISVATRLRESGFKKELHALPLGGQIDVSSPEGDLVFPESTDIPLVFIAGGIGINPFMSMMRWMKDSGKENSVTLFYSNKLKDSTPYFDELEALEENLTNLKVIHNMSQDKNWPGFQGRINVEIINQYVPDMKSALFYIVGPENMGHEIENMLISLGVNDDKINREDFAGY